MANLYHAIETAAVMSDSVLVSFSGGKDSIVTLDLCCRFFERVEGFFLYWVKGLQHQENVLRFYEDKYGIPIHRLPHFEAAPALRYGVFRDRDLSVPIVTPADIYAYMREMTDFYWIAAGERISDSLFRRAYIKAEGGSIQPKRGRFFPVAEWRTGHIQKYLKQRGLKVGFDYMGNFKGRQLAVLRPSFLKYMQEWYPQDYAKIKEWFPLIEARIMNCDLRE